MIGEDGAGIDRFMRKLQRAGFMAGDGMDANSMIGTADKNLLQAVKKNEFHIHRHFHFPPVTQRHPSVHGI